MFYFNNCFDSNFIHFFTNHKKVLVGEKVVKLNLIRLFAMYVPLELDKLDRQEMMVI